MNQFKKSLLIQIAFCMLMVSNIFTQNAELITQKINVENAIRDKVNVTVSKLLDQSKYVIIVNARMDVKAFSLDRNDNSNATENTSYYSPIPGLLPTVPQNIKSPTSTYKYSTDKYLLYGLDIAVYLEETVSSGSMQQNIKRLVEEAIPEIADCDDCIRFETMNMGSSANSTYDDLLAKIEKLESDKRDAESEILNWKFDELEKQLALSEDARAEWADQARQRERARQMSDSLRMVNLEKIEKEYRKKQDSLYLITSVKLDEAVRGRIESSSALTDKLIDIIKTGIDSNADKDLLGGDLGPDRGDAGFSSSTLLWLILFIIIGLLGFVLYLVSRNKQTVYLKPKKQNSTTNQQDSAHSRANTMQSQTADRAFESTQTQANQSTDVVQAELKDLRQSAVAMSVSQKDGANQIVQDWLDTDSGDSGNADEDAATETDSK
tara:strand:- start:373 stop:1683 length:1311 start_codon:yes stop_codon:yes gene_type:complete